MLACINVCEPCGCSTCRRQKKELLVARLVLETNSGFSGKAISAFNDGTISPAPNGYRYFTNPVILYDVSINKKHILKDMKQKSKSPV